MAQHVPASPFAVNLDPSTSTITIARQDGATIGASDHGCPVKTLALSYDSALALSDALVQLFPPWRDEREGDGTGSAHRTHSPAPVTLAAQITQVERDMDALAADDRPYAALRLASNPEQQPTLTDMTAYRQRLHASFFAPLVPPRPGLTDFNTLTPDERARVVAQIRVDMAASDATALAGMAGPPLMAPLVDPVPANVVPGAPHLGLTVMYVLPDGTKERIAFVTAIDRETGLVDLIVLLPRDAGYGSTMQATGVPYTRHTAGMIKRPHSWHLTGEA